MIKSTGIRWAENVKRMREMINACKILFGKLEGKDTGL
jgi:hypothetical protein